MWFWSFSEAVLFPNLSGIISNLQELWEARECIREHFKYDELYSLFKSGYAFKGRMAEKWYLCRPKLAGFLPLIGSSLDSVVEQNWSQSESGPFLHARSP